MKKKTTFVKPMNTKTPDYKKGLQHNVAKVLEPIKIKPKEIFDDPFKKPKKTKKK
jgi:hypothetical protein